eukprot:gene10299-17197_t
MTVQSVMGWIVLRGGRRAAKKARDEAAAPAPKRGSELRLYGGAAVSVALQKRREHTAAAQRLAELPL